MIAWGMVGANFVIEGKAYEQPLEKEQKLDMRFDDEAVKTEMVPIEGSEDIFQFKSGHLWADLRLESRSVDIVADRVVLMPENAQFDAVFDDGKLELAVYSGDVYLGFLPPGVAIKEQVDPYSGVFMNRLLVTQGNKVTITMSKVTEEIRPLLYSKLIKEVKYTQISAEQRQQPWVLKNLALDLQDRENRKQEFISNAIFRGASAGEGFLPTILQWTQINLTFIPEKRQKIQLRRLFAYLDDAIFYVNSGDTEKVKQYLNDFDVYIADVEFSSGEDGGFHYYFKEYVDGLNIFEPGDSHYVVGKFLLNSQFLAKDNQGEVVASLWQDVYEAVGRDGDLAKETLDSYYNYLDKYLAVLQMGNDSYYKTFTAYQNQLFDNLLLKYPVFYQDQYFAIKNALEKRYLDLFKGRDRDEMSQDFIDVKIDFLKRLRKFFLEGEVKIEDAKKIFSRLIAEIDALMPKNKDEVAVIALFEAQLKDISDFWGYLSSPQYQAKTYGATEEERYKNYLSEKDKIWNFIAVREDVLGEKVTKTLTKAEVAQEVKKQLMTFKEVSSAEVGEIEDSEERYVPVNIVIGGYPVEAIYDRVNGLLKEVVVYDEEISKGSVKVEALLAVLQDKFADLSDEELADKDPEAVSIESTAQRYARVYIAKVLTDEGFMADMENVVLVDEDKAIYRVQEVTLLSNESMVVTFDLDMRGEIVTNLFVVNQGEPQLIDGKFTLDELKVFIQADGKIDKGESLVEDLPVVPNKVER